MESRRGEEKDFKKKILQVCHTHLRLAGHIHRGKRNKAVTTRATLLKSFDAGVRDGAKAGKLGAQIVDSYRSV